MVEGPNPEIAEIKQQLLIKLNEALKLCEKSWENTIDQERYSGTSEVPEADRRWKMRQAAYAKEYDAVVACRDFNDLLFHFGHDLTPKRGLLFQIYEGKIQKHILPTLSEKSRQEIEVNIQGWTFKPSN